MFGAGCLMGLILIMVNFFKPTFWAEIGASPSERLNLLAD
jgi:hypothetical protein